MMTAEKIIPDQFDAPRLLFERLTPEYIQGMVGREFESNILECKQKAQPDSQELDASDIANFAKALSGFANTGGGILLWGIQARKIDEIDQIQAVAPISHLRRFEAQLRERENALVEYVVPEVQYKAISDGADKGVLAVFIPQSPFLPHRVKIKGDHHFYIRAGGTFSPLPLSIIEDLFSRRASPNLELFAKQTQAGSIRVIRVGLKNVGKASARFPFLVIALPQFLRSNGYELDGNTRLTSCVHTPQYQGQSGRFITWNDGNRYVIHPGQELEILDLWTADTQLSGPYKFELDYYAYAEGMAPKKGKSEIITA